jgi:hypothetical protein
MVQAGHFGQAPFDPVNLANDYNRQAEVHMHINASLLPIFLFLYCCCMLLQLCASSIFFLLLNLEHSL